MNERLADTDEAASPEKAVVAFSSSPFLYHAALLVFFVLALFSPLLQPTPRGSYGGMHTDPPLRRVDGLDEEASGLLVAKLQSHVAELNNQMVALNDQVALLSSKLKATQNTLNKETSALASKVQAVEASLTKARKVEAAQETLTKDASALQKN